MVAADQHLRYVRVTPQHACPQPASRAGWRELVPPGVVVAWIPLVLLLDVGSGLRRQYALGALTWLVLLRLLRRETWTTRAQVAVVVAFATTVEYVCSPLLGVYSYRLHNVPAFVPPGHGLVYLAAVLLGRSRGFAASARWLILGTCAVGAAYAAWGLFVSGRRDVLGALWFVCLALFLWRGRQPLVYVGAFMIVTYLELLGTAIGTWTWSPHDPTGLVSIGNPPSGAAGGYGFFDAAALVAAPVIVAALQHWRRGGARAGDTVLPVDTVLPGHPARPSGDLAAPTLVPGLRVGVGSAWAFDHGLGGSG